VLGTCDANEIVDVRPLRGGWTSEMDAVALPGGRFVVLRQMLKQPWRTHATELLTREAEVLELLAGTPVPAPELIAVRPPWLAMTLLPGALRLDVEAPDALARALVAIHAVDPPRRPRDFYDWAYPERRRVPRWASDASVWEWALKATDRPQPIFDACFLHRDFHPGNVLFAGSEVTGVVDWVETSWGPADLDVAHCRTALAMLHGIPAADRFRAAYLRAGGQLGGDPYWDVIDAVGFLPDPEKVAAPWRMAGRTDLTADVARRRLEAYVSSLRASPSRS
jgi:aminoglycoside phosphotransferase (APT) family kinase protein